MASNYRAKQSRSTFGDKQQFRQLPKADPPQGLQEVSACETKLRDTGTGTVVLGGLGEHKLWNAHGTTQQRF